jgi:polyhydroxyalkanoate synthesis regulator phasin
MKTTPIKSHKDLEERIRNYQQRIKSASEEPNDPTNKGTVSVPVTDEGKENLPKQKPNGPANTDTNQLKGDPASPETNEDGKKEKTPKDGNASEKVAGAVERVLGLINKSFANNNTDKSANTSAVVNNNDNSKAAADDIIEFTPAMMLKLAAVMLSTEEGIRDAERHLLKQAGREEASKLIKAASEEFQQLQQVMLLEELEKQAAIEYINSGAAELEEFLASSSEEDRQEIAKMAKVLGTLMDKIENPLEKQAFMQGAMEAAALDDAANEQGEGAEPTLPGAGEGEQLSIEQIIQILDALVQSGEIDEETATAVLQALIETEEGGEAAGEVDPEVAESVAKAASAITDLVYEPAANK